MPAVGTPVRSSGVEAKVEIAVFWEPGCPYCQRAKSFLAEQAKRKGWMAINAIDVTAWEQGRDTFRQLIELYGFERAGVALIIVGGRPFLGFTDASTSGVEILEAASQCRVRKCLKRLLE